MKRLLAALFMIVVSSPVAAADQYSLSAGFEYSTGTYGNAVSTDILYVPVTGRYQTGKLTLKLTVPYLSVTGPGGVIHGLGRIRPASSRTTTTTHSGLGDITASAGYNVYSLDSLSFDVVGNIKLATADASNDLGTGQNDYSAQIDGYYTLTPKTSFFATAGYKIYGSPAGINLSSEPYGTFGADRKLGDETNAGAMLDVARSPDNFGSDKQEVTAYISQKLSANIKVQANALKGFSNGSPDYGGGIMFTGHY